MMIFFTGNMKFDLLHEPVYNMIFFFFKWVEIFTVSLHNSPSSHSRDFLLVLAAKS